MTDIAPDVNCPHCGLVILCPHTPLTAYPPNHVGPYAAGHNIYWNLGWRGVIPVRGKFPPAAGFTGRNGADPSYADVHAWSQDKPRHNIALRLPPGVIGIDVDAHSGKTGAQTIVDREQCWGALPASPRTTSRADDPISGIRLYRIPPGAKFIDELPHVDIIQRHHRYVMCWPSIHPDTRQRYRWYAPDGQPCGPPGPDSLPELPPPWVEALRPAPRATAPAPRTPTKIAAAGRNPAYVEKAIRAELGELAKATVGKRNKWLNKHAFACFQFVRGGHADPHAVRAELERIALALGLTGLDKGGEIHTTLESAWNDAEPREIPAPGFVPQVTEVKRGDI